MKLSECKCPLCDKWIEPEVEERTTEFWSDGIPYPDRQWYAQCPKCEDEFKVQDWEIFTFKST
jgi:hypothetical protein